ncbi:MAG: glycoside hydrolase family 1 protein [Clostridiaceae bacterium]|nr:glycoside hydrolase family 1 protein [Clostridiaceae bacterium]
MYEFNLPENFMLGTATSSVQTEGGDKNNTWYRWCTEGHIKDSSSCITANDHWNRIDEDTAILKSLNVQTHRMSIEWSRIETERGIFSEEAINHYKYEIENLLSNNIKPLITLHHFSEPIWFHNIGAWENPESTDIFLEYVQYTVEKLGHLVNEWITFNEPNVYTVLGYGAGLWPPGKKGIINSLKIYSKIIKTHTEAYKLIHAIRSKNNYKDVTLVGSAMHIRIFEGRSVHSKLIASLSNYVFNELLIVGITTGNLKFPLSKSAHNIKSGRYADFIALNYYTKITVEFTFKLSTVFYKEGNDKRLDNTELGWDIYPQGLYDICKKYYEKFKLPIFITENGISDKSDLKRSDYILSHIANVAKAINEGIPVKRYYYWTLFDNFEWLEGETTSFGLVECDFRTFERRIKNSAKLYSEICKHKKFTREMYKRFFDDKITMKSP